MWMLYGANGYTGRLIARVAAGRGERPVLAGRSAEKLEPLARELGLEHRVVGLDDQDLQCAALADVDAVVHAAGPFSLTSEPMVDACLATSTHYIDITGEIDVFERIFARDGEARRAGVVLLPGAGFDVVPTDGVAARLARELPEAVELELAFLAGWRPEPRHHEDHRRGHHHPEVVPGSTASWSPFPSGTAAESPSSPHVRAASAPCRGAT